MRLCSVLEVPISHGDVFHKEHYVPINAKSIIYHKRTFSWKRPFMGIKHICPLKTSQAK